MNAENGTEEKQLEWPFMEGVYVDMDGIVDQLSNLPLAKSAGWPKDLIKLNDLLCHELRRARVEDCESIGRKMVIALSMYLGGHSVYLPRADKLHEALRDMHMYERWRQAPDLESRKVVITRMCSEHKLTDRHVLRIIAQQKQLRRAQQGSLQFVMPTDVQVAAWS